MPYRVDDPRQGQNLKPGERSSLRWLANKTASYISNVHVLEYDSMQRDPVQNRRLALLDEAMQAKAGLPSALSTGQTVSDFSLVDQTNRSWTCPRVARLIESQFGWCTIPGTSGRY
jgi:hypothetical protein